MLSLFTLRSLLQLSKRTYEFVWSNHAAAGDWLSLDIHYATRFAVRPKSILSTVRIATCPAGFRSSPTAPRQARPTRVNRLPSPFFDTSPRVF